MKSGRKLDTLVAEKIFNLKVDHDTFNEITHEEYYYPVEEYSTDISAAWTVVEKLKDNFKMHYIDNRYWVSINENIEEAETAAHAICLAALKAVGA